MPIHPTDEPSRLKVVTNIGGEMVDLESTDYREKEYKRNQQTEAGRKFVMEPLPGTQPPPSKSSSSPVQMTDEMEKVINEDLRKRGVSNKPKIVKPQKPRTLPKL